MLLKTTGAVDRFTGSVDVVWMFSVCQISAPSPRAALVYTSRPASPFLSTTHRASQHKLT